MITGDLQTGATASILTRSHATKQRREVFEVPPSQSSCPSVYNIIIQSPRSGGPSFSVQPCVCRNSDAKDVLPLLSKVNWSLAVFTRALVASGLGWC